MYAFFKYIWNGLSNSLTDCSSTKWILRTRARRAPQDSRPRRCEALVVCCFLWLTRDSPSPFDANPFKKLQKRLGIPYLVEVHPAIFLSISLSLSLSLGFERYHIECYNTPFFLFCYVPIIKGHFSKEKGRRGGF